VKKASSSAVGCHQNVSAHANGTSYAGRGSSCSGFGASGVASGCLDVYDEARSHAGGDVIMTLDVMICSSCLGASNTPHSLAGRAVMMTMDHTCCSSIGSESPLLVDGVQMVTPSGG
jgi:hypothetical protein